MHCIVFSLAVHCIINVALHCGKVQCVALLVTVTFIALHCICDIHIGNLPFVADLLRCYTTLVLVTLLI